MDPITIGLQVVGTGLQLFGGLSAASEAGHAAEVQKKMAGEEQQINAQKMQQMQLEARRQQMEVFRNAQRARAQATAAAVNQGAQLGSGLMGGLGQISGAEGTNLLGINQNKEIGMNISGINDKISQDKMQLADIQSAMATDQAWASLGGSLVKNAGTIGGLGQDIFSGIKGLNFNGLFGGGSPSGYGSGR